MAAVEWLVDRIWSKLQGTALLKFMGRVRRCITRFLGRRVIKRKMESVGGVVKVMDSNGTGVSSLRTFSESNLQKFFFRVQNKRFSKVQYCKPELLLYVLSITSPPPPVRVILRCLQG